MTLANAEGPVFVKSNSTAPSAGGPPELERGTFRLAVEPLALADGDGDVLNRLAEALQQLDEEVRAAARPRWRRTGPRNPGASATDGPSIPPAGPSSAPLAAPPPGDGPRTALRRRSRRPASRRAPPRRPRPAAGPPAVAVVRVGQPRLPPFYGPSTPTICSALPGSPRPRWIAFAASMPEMTAASTQPASITHAVQSPTA